MRISDWSSDVCSSDLALAKLCDGFYDGFSGISLLIASDFRRFDAQFSSSSGHHLPFSGQSTKSLEYVSFPWVLFRIVRGCLTQSQPETGHKNGQNGRSEEHTSELQSLMRISYAVFCLKKKKTN